MYPVVEEKQFHDAHEFVHELMTGGPRSHFEIEGTVYRGVAVGRGDNEHTLVPSALRLTCEGWRKWILGTAMRPPGKLPPNSEYEQVVFEGVVLRRFFRYADSIGLPMPEIGAKYRDLLGDDHKLASYISHLFLSGDCWPPDNLLPLLGQAQHYGLPTRLLDWSRSPLVASYFAAKGGLRRIERLNDPIEPEAIAVWRLDRRAIERGASSKSDPLESWPFVFVTAPAASNPNLRAQQGVFTLWRRSLRGGVGVQRDSRPIDEIVVQAAGDATAPRFPVFQKLTLPLTECKKLWTLLKKLGVNAAIINPDYAGAAEAVRDESMYRG